MAQPDTQAARRSIQLWREALTDFSARNPLLFFKPGKSGTIALLNGGDDLFAKLVSGAKVPVTSLRLPPPPPPVPGKRFPPTPDAEELCTKLRRKARTYIEEVGLNPLALAFELLEWQDAAPGAAATRRCRAPIVLLPVTLERQGTRSGTYLIGDPGADPLINPVLRRALQRYFDIDLAADPDAEQGPKLATYLDLLREVRGDIRFTVAPSLALGLFSFSRLVMVEDLERNEGRILAHPLLQSVLGQRPSGPLPALPAAALFDTEIGRRPSLSVLDADGSQQVAIEAVRGGTSLVVQGPPGTGKSQTITNMIAELLADGKKVLFVSAKRAALDVVLQRLQEAGIGSRCLAAHDKADKKQVVQNLHAAYAAAAAHRDTQPSDAGRLERLRRVHGTLAEHVQLLHARDAAMDLSLYDAYGQLAAQRGEPMLRALVRDTNLFSHPHIEQVAELLGRLAPHAPLISGTARSPWHHTILAGSLDYARRTQIEASLAEIVRSIDALTGIAGELAAHMGIQVPKPHPKTLRWLMDLANAASDGPGLEPTLQSGEGPTRAAIYEQVRGDLAAYRKSRTDLLALYREEIFSLPLDELQLRLEGVYGSGVRRLFSSAYKRDRAAFQALQRADQPLSPAPLDHGRLLGTVKTARNVLGMEVALAGYPAARGMLGSHYRGTETDTDTLKRALDQNGRFHALLDGVADPPTVAEAIIRSGAAPVLGTLAGDGQSALDRLAGAMVEVRHLFPPAVLHHWDADPDLVAARRIAAQLAGELDMLARWLDYQGLRAALADAGFPELIDAVVASGVVADRWPAAFRHGLLHAWVEYRQAQHPHTAQLQGAAHDALVAEFGRLDLRGFAGASEAIRAAHARGVQRFVAQPGSREQLQRLETEAHKQRQIWPVRKLLAAIPELLLQVKPCWMLSPLTVTQFVDPARVQFDVVIFDEASQIKMEEGVCAVLRAQQVVVVGDTKQLPPTSFFDQGLPEDETGESDDGAFESILDQSASHLPQSTLRWHYRSRDEALIRFSNEKYYESKLITFPNARRRADLGVHFAHVPGGVYDRGGSRINAREAEAVAAMIVDHYRTPSPSSLGVIALSQAQQEAIREALDAMLSRQSAVQIPEEGPDGLFIKNLENVQGDERDAIILSIGYARDASGVLSHNFGPLNRKGGERRLNVAVTRARRTLTVVSSIKGSDIDGNRLGPDKSVGVRDLADYLTYAETGRLSSGAGRAGDPAGSPLEETIRRELEVRGYTVAARVGHSEQRIGLAIVDPHDPDRYLLGIEVDGPTYAALPTVRDRDRLRPAVLDGLGWRLHRIWSRDWLRDPDAELARIYDLLHAAAQVPAPAPPTQRCPRCGATVGAVVKFCGSCGAALQIAPAPPIVAAKPATLRAPQSPAGAALVVPGGPLPAGTLLNGRYRVERVLGQGGFGRVYRAEDLQAPSTPFVAIKELLDNQSASVQDKQDAIAWFRREVSTLLRLSHSNIPTIHAYWTAGADAGPFYLAMNYIDGDTLEQLLAANGRPLPWQQATAWTIEICEVLAYLHGQQPPFIFRDMKLPNIMIDRATGVAKLIDFGIAREFHKQIGQTTIGTFGYTPVEQWKGRPDPRSDIHALGATLHAMLTGRRPEAEFQRLQNAGLDVEQAMQALFPYADSLISSVPTAIAQVVAQATAFNPDDRYQDAIAFGDALARALGRAPLAVGAGHP